MSKEVVEWVQCESDAVKWKRVQEIMRNEVSEWKHQNLTKRDKEEIKKYTKEEIKEAIHQIRIDRLKNILNPYIN
jgi:polyphosphate kinase